MRNLRILLASFAIFMGIGALSPVVAMADTPQSTACQALGSDAGCDKNPSGGVSLSRVVKVVVNVLSVAVGIAAVIMIIVGGFRYVTAGGDANNVSTAKNTILYAIIGLIIVAMAQFIVQFVVAKATAPSCNSKQQLNDKTNTCVPKKGWLGTNYAVVIRDYSLN